MSGTTGGDVVLKHVDSGTQVTITTTGDEENLTKSLIIITAPKSDDSKDITEGENLAIIIDLLMKAERRITVDGYLCYNADVSDTHSTAAGKKADLKSLFFSGDLISMTYEEETFDVNSDKLSIKRIVTDGQAAAVGEAEFSVKMTMVRGQSSG